MKKITLMIAVMVLAALACTSVRIADPAFQDTPVDTPDTLATVLAEVAKVTENAPTPTDIPPTEESQQPEETKIPEQAETQQTTELPEVDPATATPKPTTGNTGYPTAISLPNPSASNFYTCLEECEDDGSNHQTTYPEKTTEIFFRFEYEDFPIKAPYVRKWTKDGNLWSQYSCLWPGPESGIEELTLTEPNGLASGLWTIEITVNGELVLEETLLIEGDYSFWSPPGFFNGCYDPK